MKLLRQKKHGHRPDGTLPLINIVLLLVLAFMMAGTFSAPLPPDFDPLRSDSGEQVDAKLVSVTLAIDGYGRASHDGKDISAGEMDLLFSGLGEEDGVLEVRVDARASANFIIALLGSAERAGIKDVQLVTLDRE